MRYLNKNLERHLLRILDNETACAGCTHLGCACSYGMLYPLVRLLRRQSGGCSLPGSWYGPRAPRFTPGVKLEAFALGAKAIGFET